MMTPRQTVEYSEGAFTLRILQNWRDATRRSEKLKGPRFYDLGGGEIRYLSTDVDEFLEHCLVVQGA